MLDPAHRIITALGAAAVATACRVHVSRPYRWMAPKSAGGTGGTIPLKYVPVLLALAREKGVALRAEDFLPLALIDDAVSSPARPPDGALSVPSGTFLPAPDSARNE